ncbi:MAG: hypothetical protein O0W93_05690, partial [Methanocorpusculum sp.]|nr:hypothetical protein [Methanocorpusculum sp.]
MGLRDYGIISPDKYKERRRQCRMLTVLVLLLMCTTGTGIAVTTEVNISSGDISITDTGYTVGSTFTPWDANDHALTITGASTSNHITVENGTCTLTLSGVTIAPPDEPAISVHARDGGGAKVTLIVTGTNELKGGIGCAAIEVKAGWEDTDWSAKNSGSLEIQGDGTLNVTGGAATQDVGGGAGIGGNGLGKSVSTDGWNFGSILLTDSFTGMIYANGGYPYTKNFIGGGAGIGGGGATANSGDCSGHISICNGTLIAYGGRGMYSSGAGIGTG